MSSDPKTFHGGCHCGAVRYQAKLTMERVVACNCSICSKRGWFLTFTSPEHFTLEQGEGKTTDYQFGKKNIHHLFCATCGVSSYGWGTGPDGKKMISINTRCLDDFDPKGVSVHEYDGKKL